MVTYSASAADAMMLFVILHTTSMMTFMVGTKYSGLLVLGGPSLKNGAHWRGFLTERLIGMRRRNVWLIASH